MYYYYYYNGKAAKFSEHAQLNKTLKSQKPGPSARVQFFVPANFVRGGPYAPPCQIGLGESNKQYKSRSRKVFLDQYLIMQYQDSIKNVMFHALTVVKMLDVMPVNYHLIFDDSKTIKCPKTPHVGHFNQFWARTFFLENWASSPI